MFRKIARKFFASRLGKWHERMLVAKLQKSGLFREGCINAQKKEINLGLYGLIYLLMEPKHKLKVQMLVLFYKWKPLEETFKFYLF